MHYSRIISTYRNNEANLSIDSYFITLFDITMKREDLYQVCAGHNFLCLDDGAKLNFIMATSARINN